MKAKSLQSGTENATPHRHCFDGIEEHINPARVRDITSERLSHYVTKQRKAGLADSTIGSYLAHLHAALCTRLIGAIWRRYPNSPASNG